MDLLQIEQILITFSGAIFFGILLIMISRKLEMSPLVSLLIGGILLGPGPFCLHIINPEALGAGLPVIIRLAVGIVLFEGGLSLDPGGYRALSMEIRRVLTWGILITWLLAAVSVHYLFGFSWGFSLLSGSLIIVTGPTVIGPLLKRIGARKDLHNFLHWEGVLIDPIGVFIALLCFEWIIGGSALLMFLQRILLGVGLGLVSGFVLNRIIRKQWISDESFNVFMLAYAMAILTLSDIIIPESGLLTVTVSGFVVSYSGTSQVSRLKAYKSQLVELLIGLLFMLLSANLDLAAFMKYYGMPMLISVAMVMLVIRPVNIFVTTVGSERFGIREKLFLSWIAPRGIVAASMASIFALNLKNGDSFYAADADFLEAFTYTVIAGTVIIQGFSARWVGNALRVLEPEPTGWLIVGAHRLAQAAADFIMRAGYSVTLVDTNIRCVNHARRNNFNAVFDNALKIDTEDYPELFGTGNVLAITENEDLNELVCQYWKGVLKNPRLYRWASPGQGDNNNDRAAINTGYPVWTGIRIDRVLALDDEELEAALVIREGPLSDPGESGEVLLSLRNERVSMRIHEEIGTGETVLTYSPARERAVVHTRPQWIFYTQARCLPDVLAEMLAVLSEDYPFLDTGFIHSHLMEMESEFSSVVGHNVALPHIYVDGIDEPLVLFAKLANPFACVYSDEEILYVILVLSPRNEPEKHINTLSEISRFFLNEKNRNALERTESRQDLIEFYFPEEG